MKIRITESQYKVLVNKPRDVVFGVLLEYEKPKGTSEGDDENVSEIIKYISQYSTFKDFKESPKYSAIKNYIYRFYNKDENYNWKQITSNLNKNSSPNKLDDDVFTQKLIKLFPQWDFSNIEYYFKNGMRYLNGLNCNIKGEDGQSHGISNDIDVKGLLRRGSGCRKCALYKIRNSNKINIEKWIEDFPKDRGLIFDPNKFYYRDDLSGKPFYVKDVVCTKHNPTILFAQDGVNAHNLKRGKTGCPICGKKESQGEQKIHQELINLGYKITKQKIFNGCYGFKGERYCDLLKFDAYLKKENGAEVCIEFDGVQHFEPIPFFGGEDGLKSRQERDRLKTEFCLNNGIELIRIPYWDIENIKEILEQNLGRNK